MVAASPPSPPETGSLPRYRLEFVFDGQEMDIDTIRRYVDNEVIPTIRRILDGSELNVFCSIECDRERSWEKYAWLVIRGVTGEQADALESSLKPNTCEDVIREPLAVVA